MDTELIGFLSQLVTGIATLLVALVLVFQLRNQSRQLKIQHQDSDNRMSMDILSIFEKTFIPHNYTDEFVDIMYRAHNEGISGLSDKELWAFRQWSIVANRRLVTEWRLGRFENRQQAQKQYFRTQYSYFFAYKANLDEYLTRIRPRIIGSQQLADSQGILAITDELYEEITGQQVNNGEKKL
ncbi:MAG: hypothetical protein FI727_01720 [SAR202 cluster bacterium]|nr:hypothetical protein [SAR202 cluster bacterium]